MYICYIKIFRLDFKLSFIYKRYLKFNNQICFSIWEKWEKIYQVNINKNKLGIIYIY